MKSVEEGTVLVFTSPETSANLCSCIILRLEMAAHRDATLILLIWTQQNWACQILDID